MPHKYLLSLCLLLAPPLAAALPNVAEHMSFSRLDANRDGRISPEEARRSQHLSKNFAAADLNGDGVIDRAEFAREIAFVAVRPPQG